MKQLSADGCRDRSQLTKKGLQLFHQKQQDFLRSLVTVDEILRSYNKRRTKGKSNNGLPAETLKKGEDHALRQKNYGDRFF